MEFKNFPTYSATFIPGTFTGLFTVWIVKTLTSQSLHANVSGGFYGIAMLY